MRRLIPFILSAVLSPALLQVAYCADGTSPSIQILAIDLNGEFNIKAASTGVGDTLADFDGSQRAYPVEWLPNASIFEYNGIEFNLPPFHDPKAHDSIRSDSQVIAVPNNNTLYHSFHALATSVWPPSGSADARAGNLTFEFDDGSIANKQILVGPWWSRNPFDGPIHTPFHYANPNLDGGKMVDYNVTSISYVAARIPNDRPLKSITLPVDSSFINFFAISLVGVTANTTGPVLSVQSVRSTTKWSQSDEAGSRIQQIEVTLANLSPLSAPSNASWITSPHNITLSSSNNEIETVIPGNFLRLRSNDQVVVPVGIRSAQTLSAGTKVKVQVQINGDSSAVFENQQTEFEITAGIPEWQNTDESLRTHESPDWYEDAKFGIFIHWGIYSVPAWAPTGQQYVAWYDHDLHTPPNNGSKTWVHHLETYGPNVTYDDFIANFTASKWNADDWTDFFADAGAKYFVFVTKHHDGYALFDTGNSSHRNSVLLSPKRNVLTELWDSAKNRHPELYRGAYYSLPEWYHPDFAPYGFDAWPGGAALNAFNHSCCDPFTGYVHVDDYLEGIHKPQMSTLMFEYDADILWCDIGGPSAFPQIAASWYNHAASQNRQVVMNNRCGANQSDFVTPEYATFPAVLSQKWETSEGMDPFAYAYNTDTPLDAYKNASTVLTLLSDIVSKGGNFLLGVGPKEDGTIISAMTDPLLQVGQWLKIAGESIYGTRPWFIQPEDTSTGSTNVRFTTKPDAFYIIALSRPENGVLRTSAPVPIIDGDTVHLLGGSGIELRWFIEDGMLGVEVDDNELDKLPVPIWAFKVLYHLE
ncbi:hypothetical protein QCA50_005293 [Cerrena zonata]|uniref:alpha-L-fucosidase n=1 Tax=Cerrena zonata TaxID=2478898 RepID=A0AAW0GEF5_9APHY